jgi:hypothetical protein
MEVLWGNVSFVGEAGRANCDVRLDLLARTRGMLGVESESGWLAVPMLLPALRRLRTVTLVGMLAVAV